MLKIEKDVVICSQRRKNSFSRKADLAAAEMLSGDSIHVKNLFQRDTLRKAIQKLHGPKSTITRKEQTGGYRVWRVSQQRDKIVAVA